MFTHREASAAGWKDPEMSRHLLPSVSEEDRLPASVATDAGAILHAGDTHGVPVPPPVWTEASLDADPSLLRFLFDHQQDMVCLKDGDGRWLFANPSFLQHLGLEQYAGVTNFKLAEQGHPAADAVRKAALHEEFAWLQGTPSQIEEMVLDERRGPRYFEVLRVPSFFPDGARRCILVVRRDITEIRSASTKLVLAGRMLDQSTDGVLMADADLHVIMVNPAFCEITGFSQEEALGLDPRVLTAGQQDAAQSREMWEMLENHGRWSGEVWNRRKSGQVFPQWLTLSVLRDRTSGEIGHYVAVLSDLSSTKAAEAKIATLSTQDIVTGLPNRAQSSLRATLALDRAEVQGSQLALMVIDVDHFKTLNDSLGHAAGDQILRTVGQRLAAAAGPVALVGRLGGDEFLVVLPGVQGTAEAAHTAQRLMEAVAEPLAVANLPMSISISVGVAVYPGDGDSFDTIFGRADSALHAAKRNGRASYQFAAGAMNEEALARLRLEAALRHALDTSGLRLEYQPLIDLSSGRTVGIEALCRWDDPEHGSVPPGVFIPLAEDSGLIVSLGAWVLRAACQQLRALHDAGHTELMVAVNLSARQFQRGVLLQQVEDALVASGIPPDKLELELTESVLLHDGAAVSSTLRQLKALGVKLSIDDFGTGYSSFAYLRRIKFDKIKIDQSFVHDLIDDPDNAAIVRGIISLALSLGLHVLAEGVETEAVAQRLRHLHCTYAQGYYFARPMRPEALQERLAAAKAA